MAENANQYQPPKITVLMPVYNVSKFLPKCLQTLMDQTFRDFRLIAVNDGSTDNCLEILRDFESRYHNITVIDQPNRGMSMARNAALALADSKYVCFVDSDDYLAPTFLQELYQAITIHDADIACCYYYYHFVESDSLYKYPFRTSGVFNKEEALKKLLKDVQIQSLAWNKIYKRSLFVDHGITFPSMAFEDMATTHRLFSHAEKVVVINRALYYYNQQSASTLQRLMPKKSMTLFWPQLWCVLLWTKTVFMTNIKKRIVLLPKRQAGIVYIAH
ncbi:MAG: glycosyltransferase [Acutalibacteraceae bacterium]